MNSAFERTARLLGEENLIKLENSKVAVFGIGGVGSYAAEALVRSGLGNIVLVDYDVIDITNLNRQVHALIDTVGRPKVQVMKERLLNINENLNIEIYNEKYSKENRDIFKFEEYDYVIDAIDMVSSKIDLIQTCKSRNTRIISAMGAGNKIDPTKLEVGDIYSTNSCPLARVMRRELKKREIGELKVVWSREIPRKASYEKEDSRKSIPASVAFVPPVSGLIVASEVIKDLIDLVEVE